MDKSNQPTRLLEFRQAYNLHPVDMQKLLGVPGGTYRNWEKGRRDMPGPAERIIDYYKFLSFAAPDLAKQLIDL